jgi:hypothetical protein
MLFITKIICLLLVLQFASSIKNDECNTVVLQKGLESCSSLPSQKIIRGTRHCSDLSYITKDEESQMHLFISDTNSFIVYKDINNRFTKPFSHEHLDSYNFNYLKVRIMEQSVIILAFNEQDNVKNFYFIKFKYEIFSSSKLSIEITSLGSNETVFPYLECENVFWVKAEKNEVTYESLSGDTKIIQKYNESILKIVENENLFEYTVSFKERGNDTFKCVICSITIPESTTSTVSSTSHTPPSTAETTQPIIQNEGNKSETFVIAVIALILSIVSIGIHIIYHIIQNWNALKKCFSCNKKSEEPQNCNINEGQPINETPNNIEMNPLLHKKDTNNKSSSVPAKNGSKPSG